MRIRLVLVVLVFTFIGGVASAEQAPPWIANKGLSSNGDVIVGIGMASGNFVMERSAYFSALHDLNRSLASHVTKYEFSRSGDKSHEVETSISYVMKDVSGSNVELFLPGFRCSSLSEQFLLPIETDGPPASEKAASHGDESYEEVEEFITLPDGSLTVRRFFRSFFMANGGKLQEHTEARRCTVANAANMLKRLPIADSHVARKPDGVVETYVLVQMPLKQIDEIIDEKLKEFIKEFRQQESLKKKVGSLEEKAMKAHKQLNAEE